MTQCPNYDKLYCMDHDYDHVLERQERLTKLDNAVFQIRRDAIHMANGKMVAEASDMAMPVGHFPEHLVVPSRTGELVAFTKLFTNINADNEVTHVLYGSQHGDLVVYND